MIAGATYKMLYRIGLSNIPDSIYQVLGIMKWRVEFWLALIVAASMIGCGREGMKAIASVDEGVRLVDSFKGEPQEFKLVVPDSLLDPVGAHMAIITDRVLSRGWQPDGFTQEKGYRVYRYKELK